MRSNNEMIEMICCVDLPNLTSIINSKGGIFLYPRSVTLESISEYGILMVLDIPNLQNVSLPNSFKRIIYPVVKSHPCFH